MKSIYIWGAGHYGVLTALDLENNEIKVKGFIDTNASQIKTRLGLPVFEPSKILSDKNIQIIIAVQNENAIKEIIKSLELSGLEKNKNFEISILISAPNGYFASKKEEIEYYRNKFKARRDIYLYDEVTARNLADNWNGILNKPINLRFFENVIPVVLCADEKFSPYLAVMLQSLLDNTNSQRKYHFIIFQRNFSDIIICNLMNQVQKFSHCEIDFIDITNTFKEIPVVPTNHLSIDAFSRLFIPYWLDKYSKVIYLDSDMFAKADIAELYDLDIQDHCIGGAINQKMNYYLEHKKYTYFKQAVFIFLEDWFRYFNSGVLIFDTDKFRENISYQDLFRFAIYYTNRYKIRYNDQDILNITIKGKYFVLPSEWNFFWKLPYGYCSAKQNTKIIHFLTEIKPWQNISEIANNPDALEYRNYAMKVPLYRDSFSI